MLTLLLASFLTFVELNCENLFDCRHDTLKQDTEWLPASARKWTPGKYWHKLNNIGREIISSYSDSISRQLPDLVALTEVENDSVLFDLTRRSLLRNAGYDYVMTSSPDERGIDVALLYQPFSFRLIHHTSLRVTPVGGMKPTRDILYVNGEIISGDTLHLLIVHAPSRYGGEKATRPHRLCVAERLLQATDSIRQISPRAKIIIAGDFNDEATSPALQRLIAHQLTNISQAVVGIRGHAKATYRYKGRWQSIDHVLVCSKLLPYVEKVFVNDAPFLMTDDEKYGGKKPLRTYNGYRYQRGFSDHLPLVVRFCFPDGR